MPQGTHAYRPEIDGLRMIAVLPVVLYHFGTPGFDGGFAGVDVFFVISGYLIGGLLWREYLETGSLNLPQFYIRRVKRLAPAFFAMAVATSVVGWLILLPFEFREYGKSLVAATVYLSNVLFFRGEGYFDIGAESKVLLHTWSLSVEEQFYIALPLVLLLVARWKTFLFLVLWLSFIASLAASIWLTPTHQTATFYLFHFRAWELLAGVLLALSTSGKQPLHGPAWISWVGLSMVLFSFFWIDAARGFPGWQALLPVAGTLLLLANGQSVNAINGLLSTPGPVFIGKVSYSLYLWHWPVFVYSNYWRDGYSGWLEVSGWIALSFALGVLSWRFIETPFRQIPRPNGRKVLAALTAPSVMALGFGLYIFLQDGLTQRFDRKTQAHIQASADFLQDWSRCHVPDNGPFTGVELCPIGPEGAPEVLIWGDSHVRAIKEGLEMASWEADTPGLIIWHAGCPPLFGVAKTESYATPSEDTACTKVKSIIERDLNTLDSVHTVLLVGRWSYYATGHGIGLDKGNTINLTGHGETDNASVLKAGIERTLPELKSEFEHVLVFEQVPEIPHYDSRRAARDLAHGHRAPEQVAKTARVALDAVQKRQAFAREAFSNASMVESWGAFCDERLCSALKGENSLYFDNNHITNSTARTISPRFQFLFDEKSEK